MYVDSEWRSTIQALIGETSSGFTSGYDPTTLRKRPVRSRMRGVVGAGGEKPPATRLGFSIVNVLKQLLIIEFFLSITYVNYWVISS